MFWPIYIGAPILGVLETVKEISSDEKLWDNSWFKRKGFDPYGYFGPNQKTWFRKHKAKNKYLRRFMETWGVGFTDVYHGADTVYHTILFAIIAMAGFGIGGTVTWASALAGWPILATAFHLSYHHWFMKPLPKLSETGSHG